MIVSRGSASIKYALRANFGEFARNEHLLQTLFYWANLLTNQNLKHNKYASQKIFDSLFFDFTKRDFCGTIFRDRFF